MKDKIKDLQAIIKNQKKEIECLQKHIFDIENTEWILNKDLIKSEKIFLEKETFKEVTKNENDEFYDTFHEFEQFFHMNNHDKNIIDEFFLDQFTDTDLQNLKSLIKKKDLSKEKIEYFIEKISPLVKKLTLIFSLLEQKKME